MIKILVVDDNRDILELVECIYEEDADFETILASSGEDAERILSKRSEEIDVILSDYEMPNGDGAYLYEVNAKYRKPFLFHSSSLDYNLKNIVESTEFETYYFDKPSDFDKITNCILEALSKEASEEVRYYRLSPYLIKRYLKYIDEIYIKIGQKYLLVSSEQSQNLDFVIDHIKKGEVGAFYVRAKTISSLTSLMYKGDKGDTDIGDCLEVFISGYEFKELGSEMVEHACQELVEAYHDNKDDLKVLFKRFAKQGDFVISHSLLSCLIAFMLMEKLRLNTRKICTKFLYAYLIHNADIDERTMIEEKNNFTIRKLEAFSSESDIKVLELLEKHHLINNNDFDRCTIEQKVFNFSHLASLYFLNKKNISLSLLSLTKDNPDLKSCHMFITNLINRS